MQKYLVSVITNNDLSVFTLNPDSEISLGLYLGPLGNMWSYF